MACCIWITRAQGNWRRARFQLSPWPLGQGTLKYYYLHDDDPNAGISGVALPDNRQRLYFSYMGDPATNFEVKGLARYQSDLGVLRDSLKANIVKTHNPVPSWTCTSSGRISVWRPMFSRALTILSKQWNGFQMCG